MTLLIALVAWLAVALSSARAVGVMLRGAAERTGRATTP